jgi:hypothetical protein
LLLVKLSGTSKGKSAGPGQQNWQNNRQTYQNRQAPPQGKSGQSYYASQPSNQARNQSGKTYQKYQSQSSPRYYNVKNTEKKAGKEKTKATKKQSGKGLSALLMFLGILFLIAGTVFLSLGVGSYAAIGLVGGTVTMAIFSALFYSSALFSFIERGIVQKRFRRFNKYAAVIGSRSAVPVTEIASAVGHSLKKTKKILQDMIDCGYFGPLAYIDSGLDSFVISREAADLARQESDTAKTAETEKLLRKNRKSHPKSGAL